jgi:hypothetical protein
MLSEGRRQRGAPLPEILWRLATLLLHLLLDHSARSRLLFIRRPAGSSIFIKNIPE